MGSTLTRPTLKSLKSSKTTEITSEESSRSKAYNMEINLKSTSVTFKTSAKTPEKYNEYKYKPREKYTHVAECLDQYRYKCSRILQGSDFNGAFPSSNGFVNTVVQCYKGHHNLVIRPDDVWTAIIIQFSFYVNANAEEFRNKFVNFEGKKRLTVNVVGGLDFAPYDLFVKLMTEEIDSHLIDDEIKNWIMPKFSTTTQDDNITNGVVFMAITKKYFDFGGCCVCGIPNITLEGTVEDWQNLRNQLKKFNEYKLEKWVGMLEPIVDQFIRARSGDVDREFWQKVCYFFEHDYGSPSLSGWITAFCVFDEYGHWQGGTSNGRVYPQMDMYSVPIGVVEVDVLLEDNESEYESLMFAGHMGHTVLDDGRTLKPKSGWVIALKDKSK